MSECGVGGNNRKGVSDTVAYWVGGLVGFAIGAAFQRFVLETGLNRMNPQICKYCQWKKTNEWRWETKKNRHKK